MTHSNTRVHTTNKQLIWNYLILLRNILEAAFFTDKRPKPRSDIEDAMFVVNKDVRQPRRNRQYKQVTETAGRVDPITLQRCITHSEACLSSYLSPVYPTETVLDVGNVNKIPFQGTHIYTTQYKYIWKISEGR